LRDVIDLVRDRLACLTADPSGGRTRQLANPASNQSLELDERVFRFALPPILKRLYAEIGSGGFGPGYGLMGLTGGATDDLGYTALESYETRRGDDPDEPDWHWRAGLLPICHWGCAIYSCVDCSKSTFPVVIFDPNVHDAATTWNDSFFDECESFERWIELWARGVNLWDRMYGDGGPIKAVLDARDHAR